MKTLRQWFWLAWCLIYTIFALASCSPALSPSHARTVIVPPRAVPVNVAPVAESVGRVSRSVDVVAREAVAARDSMQKAKASADEARKLADAKNASLLAAIDDVLLELDEAGKSQKSLLAEVDTLKTERDTLAKETQMLNAAVAAKETEASGLRLSLDQANQNLTDDDKVIRGLNKSNEALLKQSASAGVYKHWCIGLAVTLLVAGLSFIALKAYRILP